ncbi:MAG: hypothetical protein HUJ72_02565 [Blautia sp.]|nr:hypothetical protein [Blautia sp.]
MENPNLGTWAGRLYVNGEAKNTKKTYAEYNPVTGEPDELCWHGRRWLEALQQDFAARADWTCNVPEDCNHAPIVCADELDISGAAGDTVALSAVVSDPDGDEMKTAWWVYEEACEYSGEFKGLDVWGTDEAQTSFTIPKDAQKGDYFTVILEVSDLSDAPMTRYAEFVISAI